MQELARQYKKSLYLLNQRINELTTQKKILTASSKDPKSDPRIIEIDDRLKPLNNMRNDLREVTKEVQYYYDRGWWRSEKYTFNARKSRSFIY